MSLQMGLQQIEHLERSILKDKLKPYKDSSYSRKWLKKARNRWLRRFKKHIVPPLKYRKGWEW